MNPGIYTNLSMEDYHASPAISKSQLDLLARSPNHLRCKIDGDMDFDSASMRDGRMVHNAVLEPETFGQAFPVGPEVNRNAIIWKSFAVEHPGKTCLKPSELVDVKRLVDAVRRHPVAPKLLWAGRPVVESSMCWTDEETGLLCRCRPDLTNYHPSHGFYGLDLKKVKCAAAWDFSKACHEYNYDLQAWFYSEGYLQCTGDHLQAFFFLAVELAAPWSVELYEADEEMVENGRKKGRKLLRQYADCLETGVWHGYNIAPVTKISLPAYGLAKE